jgi:WD40 repeat protein
MTRTGVPFLLLAFWILPLGFTSRAQSTPAEGRHEREEIDSLVGQLGSPKFSEREAATAALDALGGKALAALRKAAESHADPEVRRRAGQLVDGIERRLIDARSFRSHQGGVYRVAFSADGRQILSCGYDVESPRQIGMLRIWDARDCKELRRFLGKNLVYKFAIAPDGKGVATGGQHGDLSLWNLRTGEAVRRFPAPDKLHVMALAFSPDGRWLLSGSNDAAQNKLQLWDVETAKEIRVIREDKSPTYSIAFVPDGRALSGGKDAVVRLWDVKTGRELLRLEGHTDTITHLAVSEDGRSALSASWDHTFRLWDLESGREIRCFRGHAGWVSSARFSPDGLRVLSASHDGTVRLWDVQTGRQLRRFDEAGVQFMDAAISADGKRVVAGSRDGMLRLWRLPE